MNNIFENTNLDEEEVRDVIEAAINETTNEFFGNTTFDGKMLPTF